MFSAEEGLLREGCRERDASTVCAALPPLPAGDVGLPAAAAIAGGKVHVLAYDATYGDVILTRYAAGPPFAPIDAVALAGVPTNAVVVGDPTGPRGGVAEVGADVGRVLDIAAGAKGGLWATWRDDTADAIGVARIEADGTRMRHLLGSGIGAGAALAIAVLPDGRPVVASFANGRAAPPGRPSRLTLHVAKTATAQAATDWSEVPLASDLASPVHLPCGATCTSLQACVVAGGTAACVARTQGCAGCLPTQVCAGGVCRTPAVGPAPVDAVPEGRGSWLDVTALADGRVAVAAYRASSGDVAVWTGKPGAPFQATVISRASVPDTPADFGRFVHIMENPPGKWTLACEDTTHGRLLLVRDTAAGVSVTVVDDGLRADGRHRVGADVGFARHTSGALLLAYQDARRGDLWTARIAKPAAEPVRALLADEGAHGFSTQVLPAGAKAWIVVATRIVADVDGRIRPRVDLRDVVWAGE